jgi:hypothetical protein
MYIGGEEVVCNKEFTIKEEMLSTSSTILNNCYPKSWEQDHDYTSRFYYPKDYSQCLIYEKIPILPKEYTQVDYIQSSGTQYIDTGFKPTPNTKIETTFQFNQVTPTQQRIFANASYEDNGLVFAFYISGQNNFAWACQNDAGNWVAFGLQADTNKHIFTIDSMNSIVSIDNTQKEITSTRTNNSNQTMLFFADKTRDFNPRNFAGGKLYNSKIYDNGILVRDFIPCYRNSDNVVGLYDMVNNEFYTNQGTGVFTYGQIQETYNETLLFAGMVKNSGNISLNPRYPKYCALEILDFKDFLSTGEYLDFVISNKTVIEAIQMVVDAVAQYGFVLGNDFECDNGIFVKFFVFS